MDEEYCENDISVELTAKMVMRFTKLLNAADCGPVLYKYNVSSIDQYLSSNTDIFSIKKNINDEKIYKFDFAQHSQNKVPHDKRKELRSFLIKKFDPRLNYPSRLLSYMMFETDDEQ